MLSLTFDSIAHRISVTMTAPLSRTIILIRHAESEENVAEFRALKAAKKLLCFSLPSLEEFIFSFHHVYCNLPIFTPPNPPLSQLGRKQVIDTANFIETNNLLQSFDASLYVSSTLDRAKRTMEGILPPGTKYTELKDLNEPSWAECLSRKRFLDRIKLFEMWLQSTPHERIVIVGHSQFFRSLIRSKEYMRNCDIWQFKYAFNSNSGDYEWTDMQSIYRTPLSKLHPLNTFFNPDFHLDDNNDVGREDSLPTLLIDNHKSRHLNGVAYSILIATLIGLLLLLSGRIFSY